MRHNDRHIWKIDGDIVNVHGIAVFQTDAASASHSAANTAVPSVEDHRQLRVRENLVERVDRSVVCLELLDGWVQLESANTTCGDQAARLVDSCGPSCGVDAGKRDHHVA